MSDEIYVASFDIGKCNFAFCIEKFSKSKLQAIKTIPKTKRYTKEGVCTPEFEEIISEVYLEGEMVLHKNLDITAGTSKKVYIDDQIYLNMYSTLDEYSEYFDKCSIVLVEQQMSFGANKINTMALKLGQHCKSYFIYKYRGDVEVLEFPAFHKTQVLGAGKIGGKAMSKPERKKWSVTKTIDIFLERGDINTVDMISSQKKKDDLADVFVQLQAFKFLRYVSCEI